MKIKIILVFILLGLLSCKNHQNLEPKERMIYWISGNQLMNESFNNCIKQYMSNFKYDKRSGFYFISLIIDSPKYMIFEIDHSVDSLTRGLKTASGYTILDGNLIFLKSGFESLQQLNFKNINEDDLWNPSHSSTSTLHIIVNKLNGVSSLSRNIPEQEELWGGVTEDTTEYF